MGNYHDYGYNFGTNDEAESKVGPQKELVVLDIFKCIKYCVYKSCDISGDFFFFFNPQKLRNWRRNQATAFSSLMINMSNTLRLEWLFIAI